MLFTDPMVYMEGLDEADSNVAMHVIKNGPGYWVIADVSSLSDDSQLRLITTELEVHEKVNKHPTIELAHRYEKAYDFLMDNLYMESSFVHSFTPSPAIISGYAQTLVIMLNILKVIISLALIMGEGGAARYLLYVHYPLRLLFYYNIFGV